MQHPGKHRCQEFLDVVVGNTEVLRLAFRRLDVASASMPVEATMIRTILTIVFLLGGLGRATEAQTVDVNLSRLATNLVTHSEVSIKRSAREIWPYIMDPMEWKQGLRLRHLTGSPGEVGELFGAFSEGSPEAISLHLQNIELLPNRRRTIKLTTPNGTLLGFATWSLLENSNSTTVSYDVSMETLLTDEQAATTSLAELAEMERQGYEVNKPRFDAELRALKALVEGDRQLRRPHSGEQGLLSTH